MNLHIVAQGNSFKSTSTYRVTEGPVREVLAPGYLLACSVGGSCVCACVCTCFDTAWKTAGSLCVFCVLSQLLIYPWHCCTGEGVGCICIKSKCVAACWEPNPYLKANSRSSITSEDSKLKYMHFLETKTNPNPNHNHQMPNPNPNLNITPNKLLTSNQVFNFKPLIIHVKGSSFLSS